MHSTQERIAIVLGITESWVFAAATFMMSLKDNSWRPFDLIILHYGVKEKEQALLNQILPCEFLEFKWPVPDSIGCSRGTQMNFSRFVCFDLLDYYNKVIWMDADMMVLKPMDDLFGYGNSGLAMVPHKKKFSQIYKNHTKRWKKDPSFDKYEFDSPLLTGGLMVFSNTLDDPTAMGDWCFQKMWEWGNYNTSTQPLIHIMVQEFGLEVEEIPLEYNCPLVWETEETIIIHPWGSRKFWNVIERPLWNYYYAQWVRMRDGEDR